MLVTVLLCNSCNFKIVSLNHKAISTTTGLIQGTFVLVSVHFEWLNLHMAMKIWNFDLFWCPFKNLNQLVALDSCMERVVWKCAMSALIWCQIWRFQLLIGCLSEIHWTLGMKCQGSTTFANYHKFGENKTIGFTGVIVSIPSKSVWKSIDVTRALWCPGICKGYGAL